MIINLFIKNRRNRSKILRKKPDGNTVLQIYCTFNLILMKSNECKSKSRMFEAYMLINVVRLFAFHVAVRALKSWWDAAFESVMTQHVFRTQISLVALRAWEPDKKFIIPFNSIFYMVKKKKINLLKNKKLSK